MATSHAPNGTDVLVTFVSFAFKTMLWLRGKEGHAHSIFVNQKLISAIFLLNKALTYQFIQSNFQENSDNITIKKL